MSYQHLKVWQKKRVHKNTPRSQWNRNFKDRLCDVLFFKNRNGLNRFADETEEIVKMSLRRVEKIGSRSRVDGLSWFCFCFSSCKLHSCKIFIKIYLLKKFAQCI